MIAYLDTNAVIRLADGRQHPGSRETIRLIERADLLISPMVVLELELLHEIGRIKLSSRDIQSKIEHELDVHVCELPFVQVVQAARDEKWTRDPFDRLIVAHAKINGLAPLLSADEQIARHYARTLW